MSIICNYGGCYLWRLVVDYSDIWCNLPPELVEKIAKECVVKIVDTTYAFPGGFYEAKTFIASALTTTTITESSHISALWIQGMAGDRIDMTIFPDTYLGTIQNAMTPGDNSFIVSAALQDYFKLGNGYVKITDTDTIADMGRIISIDSDTNTITTTGSSPCNLASGSSIHQTVKLIDSFVFNDTRKDFQFRKSYTTTIETHVYLTYTNNSPEDKIIHYELCR